MPCNYIIACFLIAESNEVNQSKLELERSTISKGQNRAIEATKLKKKRKKSLQIIESKVKRIDDSKRKQNNTSNTDPQKKKVKKKFLEAEKKNQIFQIENLVPNATALIDNFKSEFKIIIKKKKKLKTNSSANSSYNLEELINKSSLSLTGKILFQRNYPPASEASRGVY